MPGLWPEIRAAINGVFWVPVGSVFTVNGTFVPDPYGPGFPADLGRALDAAADGMWLWKPVPYPARPTSMRASYQQGRSNLRDMIAATPPGHKVVMAGYSQGALVVNTCWRDDILDPAGALHHRLADVAAIITWGDPMRCPGIARGNLLAGAPVPGRRYGHTTGGIAGPDCLRPEQTPAFLYARANPGDLYTSAPVGDNPWERETEVARNQRLIYEAVMDFTGEDLRDIAAELIEVVTMPWSHLVPLVQAVWDGLQFVARGTAPHTTYEIDWAVRHLIDLGNRIRTAA